MKGGGDMKKNNDPESKRKKIIESALESLGVRPKAPTYVFVILLTLYLLGTVIVSITASKQEAVHIFGQSIAIYAFAGVFSAIANICVIFMAIYCGKKGYFTALAFLIIQLPMIIRGVIASKNLNSLPGIFSNLLAIVAISVVYMNNKRLEKAYIGLRDHAVTDILTGLPNRFAFSTLLKDLIKRNEKFVLVWIDLNNFKGINDSMGFNTGNEVLKEVSARWKAIAKGGLTGTTDFITRIGGDEFGLIIRGYDSEEDAVNTIRRYEAALADQLTVDSCDLYITASFGYAEYPTDGTTTDVLGNCANAAMMEVKRAGSSNRILRFSPDLIKNDQSLETEKLLRDALDNDTMYYHLQPQYDISHKLRGFEALARMKDPEGNMISPAVFIPVAEKAGLVDLVDAAVFRKAALFFGGLLKKYNYDITLSVNVSVRHLMKHDFIDEIKNILNASGVAPEQIEIEITESIMIDSVDKALKVISELKALGIKIAIDDFGTGYSSLSYLNKFPANLLKIDKSFIDKMNSTDSSKQYVAAIVSIGHIMGFDVIAEGVEEDDQLDTLRTVGCDFIQGYIWGRPLPAEEADRIVAQSVRQ